MDSFSLKGSLSYHSSVVKVLLFSSRPAGKKAQKTDVSLRIPLVNTGSHSDVFRRFCHDYSVLMDLLALNPFSVRSLILAQSLWLVKTRICIFFADVIACSSALGLALRSFSIFSGRISATGLPVSDSSLIICRTKKESRDFEKFV